MWLKYSQNFCVIDFETQSVLDLKESTTEEYACHPKTRVMCLGIKFKSRPPHVLTNSCLIQKFCKKLLNFNYPLIAHNPYFDFKILQKCVLRDDSVPFQAFRNFIPSELMSLYLNGPAALDSAGSHWALKNKKAKEGKDLIKLLCRPKNQIPKFKYKNFNFTDLPTDKAGFINHPQLLKEMINYCKQDILTTEELFLKLAFIIPELVKHKFNTAYLLNTIRNTKSLQIDLKLVNQISKTLDLIEKIYLKKTQKITDNKLFNINSPKQCLTFMQKHDPKIKETNKNFLNAYILKTKNIPAILKTFISLKLDSPKTLKGFLKHLQTSKIRPKYLLFGTGITGRFSAKGLNLLAIPRTTDSSLKKLLKDVQDPKNFIKTYKNKSYAKLKQLIRPTIKANKLFYGGDFSQIDFRLFLLSAGEFETLHKMFNKWDPYVDLAQNYLQKTKITKNERFIAKQATLAFIYGLGVPRLKNYLWSNNVDCKLEDLQTLKKVFHLKYKKVRPFWNKLMLQFSQNKSLTIPWTGRILYFKNASYFTAKGELSPQWHIKKRNGLKSVWGGSLTALVIQSLTSEVFHYKIRELYKKLKFEVILPIHDEVVGEAKDIPFPTFCKTLRKTPNFLPKKKFPELQGDFWQGSRYLKA